MDHAEEPEAFGVELRSVPFPQQVGESRDGPKWRAEIVRHCVAEALELLIHVLELGHVTLEGGVEAVDHVPRAAEFGLVQHGGADAVWEASRVSGHGR